MVKKVVEITLQYKLQLLLLSIAGHSISVSPPLLVCQDTLTRQHYQPPAHSCLQGGGEFDRSDFPEKNTESTYAPDLWPNIYNQNAPFLKTL